jgi:hypothetical protein
VECKGVPAVRFREKGRGHTPVGDNVNRGVTRVTRVTDKDTTVYMDHGARRLPATRECAFLCERGGSQECTPAAVSMSM